MRVNIFVLALLALLVGAPASRAETTLPGIAQMPENRKVGKDEWEIIEALGTLPDTAPDSLGADVWSGTTRSFLTRAIPLIPTRAMTATRYDLARRLLLTAYNPDFLKEDTEREPGLDLLTLRLEKLNELGAYKETREIYITLVNTPYHPRLAQAGITALLFTGDTAMACLEARSIPSIAKSNAPYWHDLRLYCQHHYTPEQGSSRTPSSKVVQKFLQGGNSRIAIQNITELNSLTDLEAAVALEENLLDFSGLYGFTGAEITPRSLYLLQRAGTVPSRLKLPIMAASVDKGMSDIKILTDYYRIWAAQEKSRRAGSEAGEKDSATGKISAGLKTLFDGKQTDGKPYNTQTAPWESLPRLYALASNAAKGQEKAAYLADALGTSRRVGLTPLIPFVDMVIDTDPALIGRDRFLDGVHLILASGKKVPESWTKYWADYTPSESDSERATYLRLCYLLLTPPAGDIHSDLRTNLQKLAETNAVKARTIADLQGVILANPLKKDELAAAYEKQVDLTPETNYEMPYEDLVRQLESAQKDRRVGAVVLSSLVLLGDDTLDKGYSEILQTVINGIKSVGLTPESRQIAKEALLGL